ncbi:hypothetical protein [Streptomyces sp. NBC_00455]|uniref:hypothetical protein n=1 Tax=Streptomyces sp. NBC_00455 TaxID=2903654 RepID=UPI002E22EC67
MNTTEPSANLLRQVALTACGRRPGKTQSCESCARKAPALLNIASTGAADALAAAICGSQGGACADCHSKAEAIINETAETLCDA